MRDADGRTALHVAVLLDKIDYVRQLIHDGADVNAQDFSGCTSAFTAAEVGHIDCVKALIQAHADFNIAAKDTRLILKLIIALIFSGHHCM